MADDGGLTKQARYSRRANAEASDVGPIPDVVNQERKDSCRYDLVKFLVTYFPNSTGLRPFSDDHIRVIKRIESCILRGGRYANGVYRGFAKTTITENAALWAILYGHRKFVPIFGATDDAAKGNLESIKRELEANDLLAEDFPEVCHPVEALEGKPQRCSSQTCCGELTFIEWTAETIVLPTITGSVCSGAIVSAHGLTAASRGMKYKRPDGVQQRPDFVLIDDPQTDESANSVSQVAKRLNILKKSILKMAGHRTSIACIINGTVIEEDDMMDTLLDQKKSPAWQSERISMVKTWSKVHEMWIEKYAAIRNAFDPQTVGSQQEAHRKANAFYLENRTVMDDGCVVSWEWCYIEGSGGAGETDEVPELSAIQHAYNLLIDDGADVFASECQNKPLSKTKTDTEEMKPAAICAKTNNVPRGVVPKGATQVTAFVDVQKKALFWMVCAWEQNFTGYVVDYGAWPDQKKSYYTLTDIRKTLGMMFKGLSLEAQIYAALEAATAGADGKGILSREWVSQDDTKMRVGRCLVDANWGESEEAVTRFCRFSKYAPILMPSHGKFYGATSVPMSQKEPKKGEVRGLNYIINSSARKGIRYATLDVNFWKSFAQARILAPMGAKGSLSLFGDDPEVHTMLSHHFTSEFSIRVEARGRSVEQWQWKPDRPDNHFWDALVGNCVAASMLGCDLIEVKAQPRKRKKKVVQYL